MPPLSRREFLTRAATASVALSAMGTVRADDPIDDQQLLDAAQAPLLKLDSLTAPLTIRSIELLTRDGEYFVRVRTEDGAEGVAVANSSRMREAWPIFLGRVAPFFIGKDARTIETLLPELYRWKSNYKWQGLAFWICVAAAEFAILDLLGRASRQSVGEMFGGIKRKDIPLYRASSNRGNTPEAEVQHLAGLLESSGARALKFRLGGRMSNNRETPRGRSEKLIPLVRDTFGDAVALYADANSSYDVPNAVRIGKLMEEHDYEFFEEPCPFDHLWETRQVTEALTILVAGGEQEYSLRRFRWTIANRGVDIVQPDLHYFGGFLRSARVARMADVAGLPCTPHMSGGGLGYLYVIHFASFVRDAGKHQEFKGLSDIPLDCPTSDLRVKDGAMRVPTGPGWGVTIAPEYLAKARVVR